MRKCKFVLLRSFILILCLSFALQGVAIGANNSTKFGINPTELEYTTMQPGGTVQLTTSAADGTENDVKWSVNKESTNIASVDANGLVTFTGLNGVATINASYYGSFDAVSIRIKNTTNTLLSVRIAGSLDYSNVPVQLTLVGNYSDGSIDQPITSGVAWSSTENNNVASVNNKGMVSFTGNNGYVKITANYKGFTKEIDTTVSNKEGNLEIVAPGGTFTYSPTPVTLKLYDGSTEIRNAVWSTNDENIATVNNGVVTFKSIRDASVTITAVYGNRTASISTKLTSVVDSIAIIDPINYSPSPVQMKLEVTYTDKTKQIVTNANWSSNPSSIATIKNNGMLTYMDKDGTLTVSAEYGGKTTSIKGTVFNGNVLKSIRINESLNYSSVPQDLTLTGILASNATQGISASSATWKSSDATIASVSSSGKVTYKGINGPLTITATYNGISASQYAYIDSSTSVKELKIDDLLYYSSSSVQLSLTAILNNGSTQGVSASKASWKSSDTTIANININGQIRYTGKNGNVTITATYGNKSATVSAYIDSTIEIYDLRINESLYYSKSAVPLTLSATDRYGYDVTISPSKASWKSSDTSIATVSSSGYVSYTGRYGYVTITAAYGNRIASQTEYITTDSNINNLEINETLFYSPFAVPLTLTSTLTNGNTQIVPSSSAVWSSSDTSIATVSSSGVITYKGRSGNLTIKATYGSRVATQTAYIDANNTIVDLNIVGDLFYSTSNVTLGLTGTLRDGNKQNIPLSSVTWKSSDTQIATVSNGVVTYKGKNGPLTITASYGSLSTTVYANIDTSLTLKQLLINETLAYSSTPTSLTLTGVFSNDSRQTVSPSSAVWKSSDTSIATVSPSGVVTYKGKSGSVTITATYAGKVATVQANISTSASLSMLKINETLTYSLNPVTLTLTGTLLNGTTQKIPSNSATWTSSNSSIATVSNGVVKFTGKEGYVSISASYGGRAASVTTTVKVTGNTGNTDNFNNPFTVTVNNKEVENKIVNKVRTIKPLHTIPNYTDSGNHWASREIKLAKELELVSGYSEGTFKPNNNVTRAEFVIMVSRTFSIPVGSGSYSQFKDLSDHFAKQSIMSLYNLGIINGYQDGTFKPNNPITRAEVVTILSKLINFSKVPVTGTANFNDTSNHWANTQINQIAYAGVLSGKGNGTFAPNDNTTRAEAISLLLRTLSLNSNIKDALATL